LVVALILMRDGMSAEDAIALIRKKRSEYALENAHFVEYLKRKM
jgi:protein-tyrosine phosphatase